jgi:hypothetical protein
MRPVAQRGQTHAQTYYKIYFVLLPIDHVGLR